MCIARVRVMSALGGAEHWLHTCTIGMCVVQPSIALSLRATARVCAPQRGVRACNVRAPCVWERACACIAVAVRV